MELVFRVVFLQRVRYNDYARVEIIGVSLLGCIISILCRLPKFLCFRFIPIVIISAGSLMVHNFRLSLLLPAMHSIQ